MKQIELDSNVERLTAANDFYTQLKAIEDEQILGAEEYAKILSETLGTIVETTSSQITAS